MVGFRGEREEGCSGRCYLGASPAQPSGHTVTIPLLPRRFTASSGVPPSLFNKLHPFVSSGPNWLVLAGSKKRTINFSALHTNHEGSLLCTNIFLSPYILSKRDVSPQNMIGVSGEAQVEANWGPSWGPSSPMSGSYGVAWSGGVARDWFWALLTAVKILVTGQEGHSLPIITQRILP